MDFGLGVGGTDFVAVLAPLIPENICVGRQHPIRSVSGSFHNDILYCLSGTSAVLDNFVAFLNKAYKCEKGYKDDKNVSVRKLANEFANHLKKFMYEKNGFEWCSISLILAGPDQEAYQLFQVDSLGVLHKLCFAAEGQTKSFTLSFFDDHLKNRVPCNEEINGLVNEFINSLDRCTSLLRMPKAYNYLKLTNKGIEKATLCPQS